MSEYISFKFSDYVYRPPTFDKDEILGALRDLGVSFVRASFDGSGDEGWVEDIFDLVETDEGPHEDYDAEIVRDFAYYVLEATHGDWEINEGSFGTVTFNVAENKILIDYNERYEESRYYGDEF